ncbi:unnamed protein product [Mytilus coruscus]|uniref:Uncharacterized protein n=1 Tax=Mytilus coruscus TaxID=42192 RepID=A0A6J8BYQ8_MYTCO|nr:unnamed protein product [Mytilus coruscus]
MGSGLHLPNVAVISPVKLTMEYIQLLILGCLITVCSSAHFDSQKHSNKNENKASFSTNSNRPNQISRSESSNVPRQISGNGSNMPRRIVIGSKPGMTSFSFKSATKNGVNFQPKASHKSNIPSQPNDINQQPQPKQTEPSYSISMNQNQKPRPRLTEPLHSNSMNQNQQPRPRQTEPLYSNSMNQNQQQRPRKTKPSHSNSMNQNQQPRPRQAEQSHTNSINQNQQPRPRQMVPSHAFSMNQNKQPRNRQTVPSHSYSMNQRQQQPKRPFSPSTNRQFQETPSQPLPNRNFLIPSSNVNQPQPPPNSNQPQSPPNLNQQQPPPNFNQPRPPPNLNQPQPPPNLNQPRPHPNLNQPQPQPPPNLNRPQQTLHVKQQHRQPNVNQPQPPPNVNQPLLKPNVNQPQPRPTVNQRQPQPPPNVNQPQPQQNVNQRQSPPNVNQPQVQQNVNQRQPPPNVNQPQPQQNMNQRQPPPNVNLPQPQQDLNQRQPPPNVNQPEPPLNQGFDFQYHTIVPSNNPNNAQKFVFTAPTFQAFPQGNKNALHADIIDKRNNITDTSVMGTSRIDIQSIINHTGMVGDNGHKIFSSNSVHASKQAPSKGFNISNDTNRINPLSPLRSLSNREIMQFKMHNSKDISKKFVLTADSFDNSNKKTDATVHQEVVLEQLNKLFENMPIFSFRHNDRNAATKGKDDRHKASKKNNVNHMNQNFNRLDKIPQPFIHKSFSPVDFALSHNSETHVVVSKSFNTYGQQTNKDELHTTRHHPIKHMVNLNDKELTQKTNLFTVSRKDPYIPKKVSNHSVKGRRMNVLSMLENSLLHPEGQKKKNDDLRTENQPSWFVLSHPIIHNTNATLLTKNQTKAGKQVKINSKQSVPLKHFKTSNEITLPHVVANVIAIQDGTFNKSSDVIRLPLNISDIIALRGKLLKDGDETNAITTEPMSTTIDSSVNMSKFENQKPPYWNNVSISETGNELGNIKTTILSSLNESVAVLSQRHNEPNISHLSILNDSSFLLYSAMNDTANHSQRMNNISKKDNLTDKTESIPTAQSQTTLTDSPKPLTTVLNTITTVTTETNSVTNAESAYHNTGNVISKFDISNAIISPEMSKKAKLNSEEGKSSIADSKNDLSKMNIPNRWNSIIKDGINAASNNNRTILPLLVENLTKHKPELKGHMNVSRRITDKDNSSKTFFRMNLSEPNSLNSSILFVNETYDDQLAIITNTSQRLKVKMKDIDKTAMKTKMVSANIANLYNNIMSRIKNIYSNAKTLDAHGEWYPHEVSRTSNPVIIIPNEAMLTYLAPGPPRHFQTPPPGRYQTPPSGQIQAPSQTSSANQQIYQRPPIPPHMIKQPLIVPQGPATVNVPTARHPFQGQLVLAPNQVPVNAGPQTVKQPVQDLTVQNSLTNNPNLAPQPQQAVQSQQAPVQINAAQQVVQPQQTVNQPVQPAKANQVQQVNQPLSPVNQPIQSITQAQSPPNKSIQTMVPSQQQQPAMPIQTQPVHMQQQQPGMPIQTQPVYMQQHQPAMPIQTQTAHLQQQQPSMPIQTQPVHLQQQQPHQDRFSPAPQYPHQQQRYNYQPQYQRPVYQPPVYSPRPQTPKPTPKPTTTTTTTTTPKPPPQTEAPEYEGVEVEGPTHAPPPRYQPGSNQHQQHPYYPPTRTPMQDFFMMYPLIDYYFT